MKTVAVLGGGPAGSMAAERLARAGLNTILFDEKLAWEKPCGGGVTFKAYNEYPFLIQNSTPKKLVHQTVLGAPKTTDAKMDLSHPLVIYSRTDLNGMLLERAGQAGAAIEKTRVMEIERREKGWRLRTKNGVAEADYCIVATGARNPLRQVGTEWQASDTMTALGYFVPEARERIDIQFLPNLQGYIWVFPRCGHLSVGIGGKFEPAQSLRKRLDAYMDERGISRKGATYFGHMLPSLEAAGWKRNRVAGDGWMAVGDAAGLVDPITGEGIYYAIRSGDLASQVIIQDAHGFAEKAAAYRAVIAKEFVHDLEFASALAKRVFLGHFAFRTVPQRMIQFMNKSARFRELMQDLFAGTQPYLDLKDRLLRNLNGSLQEPFMNFFLNRVIPNHSRVQL
ncbi:MAG TPA: geranylgeranyl reductase family protein [Bryobacteraceae bacterium]|jgi:geranylgeranyl reductase family protein